MAEVLAWLASNPGLPAVELACRSIDVIESALHVFSPEEVCFSFNGGKDSTVVFHLLRAACLRRARADAATDADADAAAAEGAEEAARALLGRVRMVYFEVEGNFPEVEGFMEDTCHEYKLELLRLPPFKQGLERLIEEFGLRAVLIGTRATDPDGRGLEHFSPTTPGWPPMMRVSPALRWDYAAVWTFLRGCNLPFCSLYADGFTSLGVRATSRPNPALARGGAGAGFRPAWELSDGEQERAGRAPRARPPPSGGGPSAGPASAAAACS
ncbi:hypothetical protein FNF27_02273 [Cafeteria roenbergensis]|uniref:FAD synthase n=1 Tax=Cafeteria roenbergensis TaxID=33653 RepID=A0A5A8EEG3_CAFRO|nr:hypothetical protein FNF27_02273 [Cafeteria roenbergensis]|mmetsp:Transcript_19876/g.76216  ORF Transcript_19876/g.76216 Transcript_19876/m.76216 type:complete len:270 (+) Transcript_19876:716-1525(+)